MLVSVIFYQIPTNGGAVFFTPKDNTNAEFDYVYLMNKLSNYADPWGRIRRLLKAGEIVRVKKGLYVLGPDYGKPYSNLVLANLIFGPSYVSFASALAHYGLIPEAPGPVWSVTPRRKKSFSTPVGHFEYFPQNLPLFTMGMARITIEGQKFALMATPEKALFDFAHMRLNSSPATNVSPLDFLTEDLRIEEYFLRKLSIGKLDEIARVSASPVAKNLATCIRSLK